MQPQYLGIYLYKRVLSVLSIQHQTIHLFHLENDGTLIKVIHVYYIFFFNVKYCAFKEKKSWQEKGGVLIKCKHIMTYFMILFLLKST